MVGFLRGILLGGVVSVVALATVSQLAGPVGPETKPMAGDGTGPDVPAGLDGPVVSDAVSVDPSAAPVVPATPVVPAAAPEPEAAADLTTPAVPTPAELPADLPAEPAPPQVLSEAPAASGGLAGADSPTPPMAGPDTAPAAASLTAPTLGLEGDVPATASAAPQEPPPQPPTTAPQGPDRVADAGGTPTIPSDSPAPAAPVLAAPTVPGTEAAPRAADLPPPPAVTPPEGEALLQPAPEPAPEPKSDSAERAQALAEPDTPPASVVPGLDDPSAGVVTNRLPRIGAATPEPAPEITADVGPMVEDMVVSDPVLDTDLPPLQRYARVFAGAAGKPLFAILLQDTGADDVNRQELAALAIPLTIVIDPLSDGAADRAAIWRAGGQEVVMAASGIPAGAQASDLEQTFQALAEALPEAVAVIDPDGATFQDNRPLATQVVPILAGQGRGLVTFDRGLNAADQVARRENLGAATIFRRLDGDNEDAPVIRRYLDRAAFKAAQDGRVAVIGALRPETIAAILAWAVEGRSATVTLAPVSALMARDGG